MADSPRHTTLEDAQGLFIGTVMVSLGIALLQHLGLATGQIAGLAILVSDWTGLGFGPVFFCLNLPFYWLAIRRMGRAFAIKTFVAVALITIFSSIQPDILAFGEVTPAVGALVAGIVSGMGLLAVFRHRASLGGIGVLAVYLQDRYNFPAGWTQMCVDAVVFTLAIFTLEPMAVFYSVISAIAMNLVIAINHRRDRYVV